GFLLLIPRTTMLGAAVALGALTNIFMLDAAYGITAKLWALHLVLCAAFLLLPDLRRLIDLFVLDRGTRPPHRPALFRRRELNYAVWGIQWALGLYALAVSTAQSLSFHRALGKISLITPMYGIWQVETFTLDGQTRPPLLTDDSRWQRVIVSSPRTV